MKVIGKVAKVDSLNYALELEDGNVVLVTDLKGVKEGDYIYAVGRIQHRDEEGHFSMDALAFAVVPEEVYEAYKKYGEKVDGIYAALSRRVKEKIAEETGEMIDKLDDEKGGEE